MPRSTQKALTFPLAGVGRREGYRRQTRPYASPWAVNVRTSGPSESRRRGGSRPGIAKLCATQFTSLTSLIPITYIDQDGDRQYDLVWVANGALGYIRNGTSVSFTAELETDGGDDITADDDVTMDFAATVSTGAINGTVRNGKLYLADSTLKVLDPATGEVAAVIATSDSYLPAGENLIALYRDRLFLAGQTNAWYCSRMGDPTDWDYGKAAEENDSALVGQLSIAGRVGDVVTAMVPIEDQVMVMATENGLWALEGDPGTGRLRNLSREVGIIADGAWALGPDRTLVFLSNDGVYVWQAGTNQAPVRFSEERVPDELREVSTSTNTISMAYDPVERGFHLFIKPSTGNGTHWWIDVEQRAFWPEVLPETMQPVDAALLGESGLGTAVIASSDGYVRYYDNGHDDDGEDLWSHVLIGPVRLSPDDVRDGLLAEIHGVVDEVSTENGGTVTWRVVTGRSASEAAELAKADVDLVLAGDDPVSVAASGTWTEGRGRVQRPRTRGAWVVVWLSSRESWSFELVEIVMRQLGRHR